MQIDDPTPEETSSLMPRVKYVQDYIIVKAKSMRGSMLEDSVASTALGPLDTAEEQY